MAYTAAQLRPSTVLVSGSLLLLSACGWVDSGVGGNEPPVTETGDYSVLAGGTLEVAAENGVLADDVDRGGRSLTAALASEPQHASEFQLNGDGSFRYTHDGGESTADQFEYTASDQIDASDPTPVIIRILHPPRAADDNATTDSGKPVRIDVLGNDTDVDDHIRPGSVRIVTAPGNGSAQPNEDGSVTYTPAAIFVGSDSFSYRVSDESGQESNLAQVTVTVQAVRLGPPTPAPAPEDNEAEQKAEEQLRKEEEKREKELAKELEEARKEAEKRDDDGDDDDDESGLFAEDDDYDEAGTGILSVGALSGVLANDRSLADAGGTYVAGINTISIASPPPEAVLLTPPAHGRVDLAPDGSFRYEAENPPATTDAFTYHLRRGTRVSAPATVTIQFGTASETCWTLPPDGRIEATLPGDAPEAALPLYRIEQPPQAGELSLLDQTTGEFAYHADPSMATGADRFRYSVRYAEGEPRLYSARVLPAPRLLMLGNQAPAPDREQAGPLGDIRYALSDALRKAGHLPDWVGSEQAGPRSGFDPDHELHPGWALDELIWGREGYPHDGLRAWLDRNRADIILLHTQSEADPAALKALLDQVEGWSMSIAGEPIVVLARTAIAAPLRDFQDSSPRLVEVDTSDGTDLGEWVEALDSHLPKCR